MGRRAGKAAAEEPPVSERLGLLVLGSAAMWRLRLHGDQPVRGGRGMVGLGWPRGQGAEGRGRRAGRGRGLPELGRGRGRGRKRRRRGR